jgi:acetoacetate decarboxylase
MEDVARGALKRRLNDVEQEMADLSSLLTIMRHIERDERLRERLRNTQLDFRLQDVWAGRLRGEQLRGALATLERLATA